MIREVIKGDFDGLMQLYEQLHGTAVSNPDTARVLWDKILADNDHHIIVAEENEEIISSCVCVVIPCLTRDQRPYAVIENVVTQAKHQGRGLATACLAYAKSIAQGENCYKIMLMTGSKQDSTTRFYEKAGFNKRDKTAFIQWLKP